MLNAGNFCGCRQFCESRCVNPSFREKLSSFGSSPRKNMQDPGNSFGWGDVEGSIHILKAFVNAHCSLNNFMTM